LGDEEESNPPLLQGGNTRSVTEVAYCF